MIQKQAVNINFAQGLDTKTDPKQVSLGKFLSLENSIFTKGGLLQKRNGYSQLPMLPETATYTTTFNTDLTTIGTSIQALPTNSVTWVNKGPIQPVKLSVLPLVRNTSNQVYCDTAIAPNGFICTAYAESTGSSVFFKYVIADSTTGQNIIPPTVITGDPTYGYPKVYVIGIYFIIVYTVQVSSVYHLVYVAIPTNNPSAPIAQATISTSYTPSTQNAFDGYVLSNTLYLAWNSNGSGIFMAFITSSAPGSSNPVSAVFNPDPVNVCTIMSVTADMSTNTIWATYYDAVGQTGFTFAVNPQIHLLTGFPVQIITIGVYVNLASAAQGGVLTVFYEQLGTSHGLLANLVNTLTVIQSTAVVSTPYVVIRSLGLASKAFIVDGVIYFLGAFQSPYQSTYFLINGSFSQSNLPIAVAILAYENGGGYLHRGLPSVYVNDTIVSIPYLFKDFIEALSNANSAGTTTVGGIYSQTGVNLATFDFTSQALTTSEIGKNLNISGGFLWAYDGFSIVEQGFHLWPDTTVLAIANSGGSMSAQQYYYEALYSWSDNQGNIFRSAGSVPVSAVMTAGSGVTFHSVFAAGVTSITVSSATGLAVGMILTDTTTGANIAAGTYITSISGTTVGLSIATQGASATTPGDALNTVTQGSVTVYVPTLRVTAKVTSPVKIEIYRWSVGQQEFYQVTSILAPLYNDPTVDSVTFVDTQADNQIQGNNLIYTAGGILEDTGTPATSITTLFDDRLWLVDAEDPNLLWFSKQVIEATPVEMSDLLTLYVAPTIGSQGSTGPITALGAMDDKLIIFKGQESFGQGIYYINGTGPDNTGANNQYSQPTFITSTIGCSNPASVVFIPQGLMFQSDKGIWLLGRDLNTSYIGAPVEQFNANKVLSAINVPSENQVRFTLDSGFTLMYDYYYGQWGTFVNIPAVSSTLYQGLHTFINKFGEVFQESPGQYLDGTSPVLMSFTTSWLNMAGLQGYQRAFFFYILGQYFTPFKLNCLIAYDYQDNPIQSTIINPTNFTPTYGGPEADGQETVYGTDSPYGGNSSPASYEGTGAVLNWRVFLAKQRCSAFQIRINEIYDPSFGVAAGQGFNLSGVNLVFGIKKAFRPMSTANTAGSS